MTSRSIRRVLYDAITAVLLIACAAILLSPAAHLAPVHAQHESVTPLPGASTPTPTLCPLSTPEPLWVEPVISPTGLLTQTLTVRIGNGEAVTVTAESGVFTATGSFNVYGNPAQLTLDLLADTAHHLEVWARVRETEQWGCIYGGYTLHTARDRDGHLLLIEQRSAVRFCTCR